MNFDKVDKINNETPQYVHDQVKAWMDEQDKLHEGMKPVYRGCGPGQCFCTGRCKEIVGWRKKNDNPIIWEE